MTSPELKDQSAGTGLNDLVEPASGELVIEFNRHCLKENTVHMLRLEHMAIHLQAISFFVSGRYSGSRFLSHHIGICKIDVKIKEMARIKVRIQQ